MGTVRTVASLAVILITIAILMIALGVFSQGAHLLFWIGVALAVVAAIVYVLPRRGGPPV